MRWQWSSNTIPFGNLSLKRNVMNASINRYVAYLPTATVRTVGLCAVVHYIRNFVSLSIDAGEISIVRHCAINKYHKNEAHAGVLVVSFYCVSKNLTSFCCSKQALLSLIRLVPLNSLCKFQSGLMKVN